MWIRGRRRGWIQRSTSRRPSQRRSSDELPPPQHVLPNRHWIELEKLQHEKNCDERHFHELLWYGYVRCVLEWLLQRQITTIDPLLSGVNQFRKIEHDVVSILAFEEIPSSHGDPRNKTQAVAWSKSKQQTTSEHHQHVHHMAAL